MKHRRFVALLEEHENEHGDIRYHTADRWLSLGKAVKRFWDPKTEIREFSETKGKNIPELSDMSWKADLAFTVDVTALMDELNTKLQGLSVHETHNLVKAFMRTFFFSIQLQNNTLTHMQTLKEVKSSASHLCRYLCYESFRGDLTIVKTPRMKRAWFPLPLASLLEFYSSLKEENFPNMRRHAQKMLVLFGSTYICEQTFLGKKLTKSKNRSSLTDDHLSAVLRISTADVQPDFDALGKKRKTNFLVTDNDTDR